MKKLNVLIGKVGKSIQFNSEKWGIVGGDAAPSILYTTLAAMNPDVNFYTIGTSDLRTLSPNEYKKIFPNENIIDCTIDTYGLKKFNKFASNFTSEILPGGYMTEDFAQNAPLNFLKSRNIVPDFGIIMSGQAGVINMNDRILKVNNRNEYAKSLFQFSYFAGPIIHTLNMLGTPFFTISEDPRHIKILARDLFNREHSCLSQINATLKINHINNYEEQVNGYSEIPVKYAHTEKIFLMGEEKQDTLDYKKDILITMFMNSHTMNAGETRKPFIDEYIHSNFPETKVYGKWSEEIIENDNRYEVKRMGDIIEEVKRTKYTLVVSIKPGFVTCKPWEMINFGIIPFLHPTYDTKNLLGLPEFLYVKNVNDFKEKIEYLESHPEDYKKLRQDLQNMLKEEYYNGSFMNKIIMQEAYDMIGLGEYKAPVLSSNIKISSFAKQIKNMKQPQSKSKSLF